MWPCLQTPAECLTDFNLHQLRGMLGDWYLNLVYHSVIQSCAQGQCQDPYVFPLNCHSLALDFLFVFCSSGNPTKCWLDLAKVGDTHSVSRGRRTICRSLFPPSYGSPTEPPHCSLPGLFVFVLFSCSFRFWFLPRWMSMYRPLIPAQSLTGLHSEFQ